jgi:hypothetical protein
MDMSKFDHWADTFAQIAGFRPTEISLQSDLNWAQKSAEKYWTARRTILVQQYIALRRAGWGDREAVADWNAAYDRFNDAVPWPEMRISMKSLNQSFKRKEKNLIRKERGLPIGKKYRGMYEEIEEGYPSAAEAAE